MNTVEVIIPWGGPGCPHREAALRWVLARYAEAHPDWRVTVAESRSEPWCKALAVQPAVERSHATSLLVADADVWADNLAAAVDALRDHPWAIPHRLVHRLTPQATSRLLAKASTDLDDVEQPPYKGVAGGGIVVLPRDTYLDVPLDPRLRGWGQEDESWGYALRLLAGDPWRGRAPLTHLWHPPQPRLTRSVGSVAGERLRNQYALVRNRPERMRGLVEAGKNAWPTRSASN